LVTRNQYFIPINEASLECYIFDRRNLRALLITETELKLIAAAAIIGLRRMSKDGHNTPAAIGTLIEV
jgi:hypothetical protein